MESTSSRQSDRRYERREHSVPQAPDPVPCGRCKRRAGTCYGGSVGSFLSPALVLILYPAIDLPITLLAPLFFSRLQYSLLDSRLRKRVDTPSVRKSRLTYGRDNTMGDRGALVDEQSLSNFMRASASSSQQSSAALMAPAAARPISKPANSDAHSLLTLPGEICNGIYEALFKSESPLILAYRELENDWRHP
jgi:hypothetical protein